MRYLREGIAIYKLIAVCDAKEIDLVDVIEIQAVAD